MGLFDEEKYRVASQKALAFIKRQLNVNEYTLFPLLRENYDDAHMSRVFASVAMPPDARVNFPKYIFCDQFYDELYQGVCSGHHQNTGDARRNLGVEITTYTDAIYRACVCPLHEDGSWRSEGYYKETDYYGIGETVYKTETYWYRHDRIINESGSNGLKGFTLKYYRWLDEDGSEIDVDNLPDTVVWESEELPILDEQGHEIPLHFIKAETYSLRPELSDDDIIDDALPKYADYDTVLYVYADVEYKTEAESIIYDGNVKSSDLPSAPPVIPPEPEPYIRDSIVQPGTRKGRLIITWISNFADDCRLSFNGSTQRVSGEMIADGYYTYHASVNAPIDHDYTYTITGRDVSLTKSFTYDDNDRYLLAGDPQIIDEDSAEVWYQVMNILNPLPTLIIGMGDQVDAITDGVLRKEQYRLFTDHQSVPIATVRGNHDRNIHFLGHYGLPNAEEANFYFLHNGVLFIAIDSNSKDMEGLKSFIRSALRSSSYTWAVLLMHHSLFSSSEMCQTAHVKTLRNSLTDFIVNDTNIDFVLAGHEHFMCRTTYPGKLFFTVPTCTGSKYQPADNQEVEWNEVTIYQKKPMYTIMDVTSSLVTLTTKDLNGNVLDICEVRK